jgi:hypothetical protein
LFVIVEYASFASAVSGRRTMQIDAGLARDPRSLGLAAAAGAVGLGLCYLVAAGAPVRSLALNSAALLVGLAGYATIALPRWRIGFARNLLPAALGLLLLATALFGTPVDGASRWAHFGPLTLQVSFIIVPMIMVGFAAAPRASGAAGLAIAALALALQPDRGMAGVLVAGLAVLAVRRPDRTVLAALAAAVAASAVTLLRPDRLPAVPFVDGILFSAFDVHPLAGAGVLLGAALLPLPALAGRRDPDLVFGAVWLAALVAAALGNYPTPLVGFGGSAIVGYLLSLSMLPRSAAAQGIDGTRSTASAEEPGDRLLLAGPA